MLRNWVRAVAIVDATNFTQEVQVFSSTSVGDSENRVVEHLWIFGSKSHFIMMCAVTHVPWWSKKFQNFWMATKFSDRFEIEIFTQPVGTSGG
jgi:hypothetical protein